MAKRRSIRDGRPTIRDAGEAQRADYGAGDLFEIVGLTRGQLQSWLADGIIRTLREDRGVRVFNFSALVDAAVARSINNALPRISVQRPDAYPDPPR